METKELKIEIPEGFEIDKENSSFEKIVFKKKEDDKPRSLEKYWKQQREKHAIGYYITGTNCDIRPCYYEGSDGSSYYKNVLPSKELAEAFLAMMQLMSLRQAWIDNWKPDWKEVDYKHYICVCCNILQVYTAQHTQHPLSFPTVKMAQDFINTFKDLLEVAKPLI